MIRHVFGPLFEKAGVAFRLPPWEQAEQHCLLQLCVLLWWKLGSHPDDLLLVTTTLGESRSAPFYAAGIARNGIIGKLRASAHSPDKKIKQNPIRASFNQRGMTHFNYLQSEWTFEGVACLSLGPTKTAVTDSKFPSVWIWYLLFSILSSCKWGQNQFSSNSNIPGCLLGWAVLLCS